MCINQRGNLKARIYHNCITTYVTGPDKTGFICTRTEIHLLMDITGILMSLLFKLAKQLRMVRVAFSDGQIVAL